MERFFKKFLLKLIQSLLILVTMTSCFDSGSEEGDEGGGLFNGHQNVENILVLVPPAEKTYLANQNIDISFRHASTLSVTGSPFLELDIDGNIVNANYLSGSGTNTITFRYTVQAGENDSDGIELAPSLNLNGGTIDYVASGQISSSVLTYVEVEAPSIKIDTTAPSLTAISPPLPKTYLFGETLYFSVMFDETVTVTGTPRIPLDIGGNTRYATYISSGSSNILNFQYTIVENDQDLDGLEHYSPIELNGGTISDTAGNNAQLTFAPFPMLTTYAQGEIPYVESITLPTNDIYYANETLSLSLVFNKVVNVSGLPRVAFDLGGVTKYFTFVDGGGTDTLNFQYQVFPGDFDEDGIQLDDEIDLNSGSIQDANTNNTDLNLTAPVTPNVLVDAENAYVTAVFPPADNTYEVGEELFITLEFNRDIIVSGTPRVPITLDSGVVYADYIDGSNSDSLIFKYTVASGEADPTGIQIQNAIDLNSGTMQSSNGLGINLDMTTPVGAIDTSSVFVDASVTYVTSVTPPTDNTYVTTESVDFTVGFSALVNVTGVPRIVLDVGGSTLYATYLSGTGTSNLVFRYVVNAPDLDSDGIALVSNSIDLNGGTIRDANTDNALLDMSSYLPDLSNVFVNASPLNITSITPPADSTYIETQDLSFIVNTSDNVNVSGTPRISLDIGGTTKYATYDSGTGTSALTFIYTVENALSDLDGIVLTSPLDLNGGTIQDASLNNLDLNFTLPNTSNVFVDSEVPTIAISNPADASYINIASNTTTFTIDGTCSEAGQTVSIEVDAIAATSPVGFVCDGTNFSGTINVTGLTEASHAFVAKISDTASNEGISATNNSTKDITAPTLTLDPAADVTVANENSYSLSGTCSATENGETISLAFGSEVNTTTCGAGTWSITGWDVSAEADNAAVTITADLTDLAGNPATQATDTVDKNTSAPTISLTTPTDNSYINSTTDNSNFAITGTCNNAAATFTVKIDGVANGSIVCDGANITGGFDSTLLTEASHTIVLEVDDGVNPVVSSATHTFIRDVTAPEVTSVTPPANATYIELANLDFTVAFDENITQGGSPFISIDIDGNTRTPMYQSGTGSQNIVFRYSVGVEEDLDGLSFATTLIDLNGGNLTDAAGNVANLNLDLNSALPSLAAIFVDGIVPTITIDYAPDITQVNETSYYVSGSCSESGQTVDLNIGILNFTPTCSGSTWNSGTIDVSTLADNPAVNVTADISDAAGNDAVQASTTVSKDSANPVVTITYSPDINQSNVSDYYVTGTCSEAGQIVDVFVDSVNAQPVCTAGGTWNTGTMILTGVADDPAVVITADHSTATQASTTVVKDTTSDLVTISSASSITSANETSYIVTGTCSSNGNIVDVNIDVLNFQPNCNNGSWSTGFIDVSSLADGSITITADHLAATQASVTVNKSSGTPSVSNLSVPLTYKTSVDLQWTLSDPGGFTIDDHEIQFRLQGTPTWNDFDDGIDTSNTSYVDSLTAATIYEFRVRVQYDTSNFSEWSNIATGETKPDSPLFDSPYIVMNVGGATTTNIVAYYDNTRVYHNGTEIPESPLAAGDVVNKTTVQFDTMDADKPIYVAGRLGSGGGTAKANIVWQPTSWAGKTFTFNADRNNPQQLYVFAIEDTTVTVKQGATTLATSSGTITAGTGQILSWSVFGSYQVTSTGTILAFSTSGALPGTLVDPKPLLPSSTELIGIPSRDIKLTSSSDNTNYNLVHSNSTTGNGSLDKLDVVDIAGTGTSSQFQENSLLILADNPIAVASYADSNGNCAAPFLPTNLMRKYYAINNSADWVAFASKESGTIDVYDNTQTIGVSTPIQTLTLTRSGADPNAPYKAYITNPGSGYRFAASVPMGAWYQPNNDTGTADQDETILVGTDELF